MTRSLVTKTSQSYSKERDDDQRGIYYVCFLLFGLHFLLQNKLQAVECHKLIQQEKSVEWTKKNKKVLKHK